MRADLELFGTIFDHEPLAQVSALEPHASNFGPRDLARRAATNSPPVEGKSGLVVQGPGGSRSDALPGSATEVEAPPARG